jgi:hypothetical protein
MKPIEKCSVSDCAAEAKRRGWCFKHYQRWQKHGDPLLGKSQRPNGSGSTRPDGYRAFRVGDRNELEHVQIAERAFGKKLPAGAQVHHWDKDGSNNEPTNLVICPDQAYHRLLHRRADALDACGHAHWLPCRLCKQYGDPASMYVYPNGNSGYHRECSASYERAHKHRAKTAA